MIENFMIVCMFIDKLKETYITDSIFLFLLKFSILLMYLYYQKLFLYILVIKLILYF
jgi:hypothetical protein